MGFVDAQLAQGYSQNMAVRSGLLSQEDRKAISTIQNGLQMAENILSIGMANSPARIARERAKMAEPGSYRSNLSGEFSSRMAQGYSMGANFRHGTPRFHPHGFGRPGRNRPARPSKSAFRKGAKAARKGASRAAKFARVARRVGKVARFII